MGNKGSSQGSALPRGGGTTSDIRDAIPRLPGTQPKNKTGRKVTSQKIKTATATGVLALQEHGLKEIPEEVFKLINLRTLNLATNSLKLLPGDIRRLTKLKTLRLDGNQLEVIHDLSPLSALTDVSISGNRLNGVGALGMLPPSLVKLALRDNKLGGVPMALLEGAPNLQVLREVDRYRRTGILDLSANAIESVPSLAEALPALAELILDENALRTLGNELVGLPRLKKLSARSNRIAAQDPATGEQSISQALFAISAVESLELAGNMLEKGELITMAGADIFLTRRQKHKNKNLQGGALLELSVCGLD